MLIHITYVTLTILMLCALYKSGCRIARLQNVTFKSMLKASWLGIVAFTLNEGLRFGRGLDYNIYANMYYSMPSEWFLENHEFVYANITAFLKDNGLPFQILVMLMSFILIISLIYFLRNFRDAAPWALPAFAILCPQPENLMRWYFGASFLIMGFSFLLKENRNRKDLLLFFLVSFLAFFIHYGLIVVPIIYYLVQKLKRPLLKPWLSISLFFLIGLFFKTDVMLLLTDYVNIFSLLNVRAEGYVDNANQWLMSGSEVLTFSAFPPIYTMLMLFVFVWLGYRLINVIRTERYIIIYNMFVIGFILQPISNQIEIFNRYHQLLYLYQFVICGYILGYLKSYKHLLMINRQWCNIVILILCGYMAIYITRPFRMPEYYYLYIWNSEGQKYLDLDRTYYKDMWTIKKNNK